VGKPNKQNKLKKIKSNQIKTKTKQNPKPKPKPSGAAINKLHTFVTPGKLKNPPNSRMLQTCSAQ